MPLFIMRINASKLKAKLIVVASAIVLTALAAVAVSVLWGGGSEALAFETDLGKIGGAEGFLGQFSLEVSEELSRREITLPKADDEVFSEYADFQHKLGFKVLELSEKEVEERYLKLKNKTEKGKTLYAVILILKEKVVAAHLTTFEQGTGILPLGETV